MQDMKDNENEILIEFNIEEDCYNAGKINSFGQSCNPEKEETLIPPYSVCIVKKKEEDKIVLDLAFDNQNYDFLMKPRF